MAARLYLGLALTLTMAIGNIVQFAVGALGPFLVHDLQTSRTQFGLLLAGYYLVAAVLSAMAGTVIDRIGPNRSMRMLTLVSALSCAIFALAGHFWVLIIGMLVAGIAAAAANPSTNLALSRTRSPPAMLVGAKQSGVQAAALFAGLVLPGVALLTTWHGAFGLCAFVCLICLSLLSFLPKAGRAEQEHGPRPAKPARDTVLITYALLMGAGVGTVNTYLPLFAHEAVGLSAELAGLSVAVVGGAAVVARIGWSVIAGRWAASPSGTRSVLLLVAALSVAAILVVAAAQWAGVLAFWIGVTLVGLTAAAWNGVLMLSIIRDVPADAIANASGRVQSAFFCGLGLSPPLFGLLVDTTGSYVIGWFWTALCCAAAAVTILAARVKRGRHPITLC